MNPLRDDALEPGADDDEGDDMQTTTSAATTPQPWPQRLRRLLRDAVQAPSTHNSQPWRVRIDENVLELLPDRRRCAPVVDPDDRELAISCGAFLFHLRVTARHHGLRAHVTEFPPPADDTGVDVERDLALDRADVYARVVFHDVEEGGVDLYEERLWSAIAARRTWRFPFAAGAVDAVSVAHLCSAVAVEDAHLVVVDDVDRRLALARLVSEADREQWADPAFRQELSRWVHAGRDDAAGVGADAAPGPVAGWAPLFIRTFDLGARRAAHDEELVEGSPLLCVLLTDGDHERDWLTAGQALDRLLLTATSDGLAASFLNQPLERPHLRQRLQALLQTPRIPQLVLRVGRPDRAPPPPSPRRSVEEIIVS